MRFGAFSLYLPALLTPEARAIGSVFAELAAPRWRPAMSGLTVLPHPAPPPEALSLRGLRAVAGLAMPALSLERLDALARNSVQQGTLELTPELMAEFGWKPAQAEAVMRVLGFVRIQKGDPEAAEPVAPPRDGGAAAGSPAPLAATVPAEPRAKPAPGSSRRARRRRARRRAAAAGSQA